MALIIETGSGVAGAESWADVASYIAWATRFYGSAPTGTTAENEAAIRRAVAHMDGLFWKGSRALGRGQSLSWPRSGVTDCEGISIATNAIPPEVIFAQHVFTMAEQKTPSVLSPSLSLGSIVKRSKVDVIEQEFDTSRMTGTIDELRPIITMGIDKLRCLLSSIPGNRSASWAVAV